MRVFHVLVLSGVLAWCARAPARAGDASAAFAPYEDLLEVVADLTWHLRDDVYRFPPPKDPTGHDLYHLTLDRLTNWETRYPGRFHDVTSYARAQALERLGSYAEAQRLYTQVGGHVSDLGALAHVGAGRASDLAGAAALPEDAADLETQLHTVRKKLDAWQQLIWRYEGTPYQALALVEEERLERQAAALLVAHRTLLADGNATAERALLFLIEKHAESKNLADHIVRLGDLYAAMAHDYVDAHPQPLAFSEDEFVRLADRALDVYRKVATWDGAREKPEAQGRFSALDAFKDATLARYR